MLRGVKVAERLFSEREFWSIIALAGFVGVVASTLIHGVLLGFLLLALSIIILVRFIKNILSGKFTVDLLMGVAGLATWLIGSYFEGFLIFILYSISELLEHFAEKYAEKKITSLTKLLPNKIRVKIGDGIVEKNVEEVVPGEIVVVRPGETVPVDGILVSSEGVFDTSMVTGESEPRTIRREERVESGYINTGGMILVRALKKPQESLLQLLIREAERALEEKSRFQRLLEKISKPYTLLVLTLFGLALVFVPPYNALAILLAGCPSAFIIASAVSTTLTIALLARVSAIVRGGQVLEDVVGAKTVVFDKTGTLTLGELEVVEVHPYNDYTKDRVLELAGAAAKASIHPVSRSLAKHSSFSPVSAKEHPGRGVEALVNGVRILLGSKEFLEENGVSIGNTGCRELRSVYVGVNGLLVGEICLAEKIDDSIRRVIEWLKNKDYRVIIASGDRLEHVKRIAEELGVEEYYGEMSPVDKSRLVEELKKKDKVIMVGDGVNDLEALAKANIGVAIGRIDVVSSIADIVLDHVKKLPLILEHAKRHSHAIATSIILAAIVKTTVMVAGIAGLLPLWAIVGLGDDGATLLVLVAGVFPHLRRI